MKNLKELRKKQGLRQVDVAKKLNVSRVAVSKWENGVSSPKTQLLPKLAKVLRCQISDFLY